MIKGIYDTMDLFTDEIVAELTKMGHRCVILHMETMDVDLKKMMELHKEEGLDGVITFNNLGYNLGEEQGGNLWDALNIPYVNILMDHPFHYTKPLKAAPKHSIVMVIDRNHVDYVKRFFSNIEACYFLPHAGCAHAIEALEDEVRDIDVLYAGSLSRFLIEQLIPDFKEYPEVNGVVFSRNCLESLIQNPEQTTETVVEDELRREFQERQLELTEERLEEYIDGFRFLDGFAVSYFREMAVRILVEHGVKVHVLGLGWEQCDWARENENFIYMGKVDAQEVLPVMKRSKVVLNTLTWFKDGAHDRIFNGMLCGAAVISDRSKYLDTYFENHKEIELFSLKELMQLPERVKGLLEDDERREAMAVAGNAKALQGHTWRNAVEEILHDLG